MAMVGDGTVKTNPDGTLVQQDSMLSEGIDGENQRGGRPRPKKDYQTMNRGTS